MSKVLIIGGGAAGIMAGIAAAYNGNEVHIFEKNEKIGKKLFITGKGRCNVTNASDIENHLNHNLRNEKFLYSAYNALNADEVCTMIENAGVPLKIERGNRVFPVSDKSSDIIRALTKLLNDVNVQIHLNTVIKKIEKQNDEIIITDTFGQKYRGTQCIVATGGLSYPVTGSSGDGYLFAKEIGHSVTKTFPSLVPLNTNDEYCKRMQGLSLKNVALSILDENNKQYYKEQGEMLFTHFGISGPLVLSASAFIADHMKEHHFKAVIDLKPALDYDMLDRRILKDFDENINRNFQNAISRLLPKKMIPIIIELSGIDPYKKVHLITKEERAHLVSVIKEMTFEITGLRGFHEAIITKGGISTNEINPKTMESKLCPGIFFVGEVLDLDALTGGYNLQIAWSTGYLAGSSIY